MTNCPKATQAQAIGALSGLRHLLAASYDQNRALYAAVAALLPSPAHALLMYRADDPDEEARMAMAHGIRHARVLLEKSFPQALFDLDCGVDSLLDTLETCVAFTESGEAAT